MISVCLFYDYLFAIHYVDSPLGLAYALTCEVKYDILGFLIVDEVYVVCLSFGLELQGAYIAALWFDVSTERIYGRLCAAYEVEGNPLASGVVLQYVAAFRSIDGCVSTH
jgi:hypothetical protein